MWFAKFRQGPPRLPRRRHADRVTALPICERLEDRAVQAAVVADFSGFGLYRFDTENAATGWQQLNGHDPAAMPVDPDTGDVVATFRGFGTYEWTQTGGWSLLTGAEASVLAIANDANSALNQQFVAGEFRGSGVWLLHTNSGWQQATAADAVVL